MKNTLTVSVLVALMLSSMAGAATTFNLLAEDSTSGDHPTKSAYAYQYNYSSPSGLTLEVTGWSQKSNKIGKEYVGQWTSGIGIEEAGVPGHSVDNDRGFDMALLCFSEAVTLESVTIGWWRNDTDMTVMALTGGPFADFTGKKWTDLTASMGWVAEGDYFDGPSGTPIEIATDLVAQYWLVGAYNWNLSAPNNYPTGGVSSGGTDNFKLTEAVVTSVIPAPGSFALAAIGIAAARISRKRRRA